jgi:peptidylprolyl isomerase
MSKKTHEKELARARAKRDAERRAHRRNRNLIVGAVVFVVLVGGGIGLATLLGNDGEADTLAIDEPAATQGSADPTAAAAPCPSPSDAPTPDTTMQWDSPPDMALDPATDYSARIETTCGTIVVDLAQDGAPNTVNNFVFLANQGFYTGVPFHRISSGFVIQGGDPTGTGSGGPGYEFADELDLAQQTVDDNNGMYPRGTLAMANAGADTNGSQFFIVQADPGYAFPPNYAVFGHVVEGMDVVDDIANGPVTGPQNDQAVNPARILSVQIVETPADAAGSPSGSASPTG